MVLDLPHNLWPLPCLIIYSPCPPIRRCSIFSFAHKQVIFTGNIFLKYPVLLLWWKLPSSCGFCLWGAPVSKQALGDRFLKRDILQTLCKELLDLLKTEFVKILKFKMFCFDSAGCDITAKAEHLNPGGSVKDRAALYLIKQAEENGLFCILFLVTSLCIDL